MNESHIRDTLSSRERHSTADPLDFPIKCKVDNPHLIEQFAGLRVFRGTLTQIVDKWYASHDGKTEYRIAYLKFWCPECRRDHTHGWELSDGYDVISHRCAHCDQNSAFRKRGYYISVAMEPDVHCHPPGEPITRPLRRRLRSVARQTRTGA